MRDADVIEIEDAVLGCEELLPEVHFHLHASSNMTLLWTDGMAAAFRQKDGQEEFPLRNYPDVMVEMA